MHSHAFLSGLGASSRGYLDTDSSPAIPCCATERVSRLGGTHGCEINISIPKSTVTPWLKFRAGSGKMASNTCAPIQVQCYARSRRSYSQPPQTTGESKVGWHR